ncbi:hypothetical protein BO71DRAFT_435288 [Aspergillus ellipticus CBS 707.79]|uniref:Uncharacterized protein n=1 Tax=Aspergillus ellipticus CBS 707.79 TaxID=1448320 RepID=A0A319DLF9_9EURO|nr:hypothetical protein BO71DRAFT_435288 [Aspergillus ellipticus CBS 707.79]
MGVGGIYDTIPLHLRGLTYLADSKVQSPIQLSMFRRNKNIDTFTRLFRALRLGLKLETLDALSETFIFGGASGGKYRSPRSLTIFLPNPSPSSSGVRHPQAILGLGEAQQEAQLPRIFSLEPAPGAVNTSLSVYGLQIDSRSKHPRQRYMLVLVASTSLV